MPVWPFTTTSSHEDASARYASPHEERENVMAVAYACNFCGYHGRDEEATLVEEILCPMCGEPCIPWPNRSSDSW